MPADVLDPSDAPAPGAVPPTEAQRALRATLLGAVLGTILALLSRRRRAGHEPRYWR